MRLTNPAIAPPPYKVEAEPLMISTCFKSNGGVCKSPKPLDAPEYRGKPSFSIWVYLPSKPCMRIEEFAEVADVCCV